VKVDNSGPQTAAEVVTGWNATQKEFPNAVLVASSLDDFVIELEKYKNLLPVVTQEIGDTWIYGNNG
jgi:hypothetical protein